MLNMPLNFECIVFLVELKVDGCGGGNQERKANYIIRTNKYFH